MLQQAYLTPDFRKAGPPKANALPRRRESETAIAAPWAAEADHSSWEWHMLGAKLLSRGHGGTGGALCSSGHL